MFNNLTLLITGGTGSFGYAFTRYILDNYKPKKLIIFSRDEMKQWKMKQEFKDNKKLRFFIGDVRDKDRMYRALEDVDYVVHAAALKIVPFAEYNPFEYIKTNILGAMNLIDAAIDQKVKKVVALSTDKASSPINLYGATKLASDKLFSSSNSSYALGHKTKFAIVRYGNVMGSRGSVIPFFLNYIDKKKKYLPITDIRMTRFMITLEEGIKLVCHSFKDMVGGEIYVKKIPSIKILDLAKIISPKVKYKIIGIRPGEKLHEQMISEDESIYTYEYKDYYKILPNINDWDKDNKRIKKGKKVPFGFAYKSDTNKSWVRGSQLRSWIEHYRKNYKTVS